MAQNHQHRVVEEIRYVVMFVAFIWIVFFLDQFLPLEQLALLPRSLRGIPGIVVSPFLHGSLEHIIGNSLPLFVLLMLMAGSRSNSAVMVVTILILAGVLHWCFGRNVFVVGISGLVFGLISFLILSGIFERRLIPLLVSVIVAVTYGTTLFTGVLPGQPGVSWDGHLFGAIAGAICAWVFARPQKSLA